MGQGEFGDQPAVAGDSGVKIDLGNSFGRCGDRRDGDPGRIRRTCTGYEDAGERYQH